MLTPKKSTVFLDPRSQIQQEVEKTEEEIQQIEKQKATENIMGIINGLITYLIILPLLFLVAYNMSLTNMFNFDKIGYPQSLGIVVIARILRGSKKND
jgi:type IV secretory pathway TrbL component